MAKIVAIVNQKGGVGKTTTCVNLTAALKEKGLKVLLCDFDPQANATSGMGVDKTLSQGIYDVLINGVESQKRVVSTRYGDVLPSCIFKCLFVRIRFEYRRRNRDDWHGGPGVPAPQGPGAPLPRL